MAGASDHNSNGNCFGYISTTKRVAWSFQTNFISYDLTASNVRFHSLVQVITLRLKFQLKLGQHFSDKCEQDWVAM